MKPNIRQTPEWFQAIRLGNEYIAGMHKILEERTGRRFSIEYREATLEDCRLENDRCLLSFNFRTHFDLRPGIYTYLCEDDEYIMSDTSCEIFTNVDFISHAHGDVLIGGLGLGILPMILKELDRVNSVLILEKKKEVIDLVWPQLGLPRHIEVVNADVFEYAPNNLYNTIYHDIWSDIDNAAEKEMHILKKKYKPCLKAGGWLGVWEQK